MKSRSSPQVTPTPPATALQGLQGPSSARRLVGPGLSAGLPAAARQPLPPPGGLLALCRADPSPAATAAGVNEGGATKGTPLEGDHSVGYLGTMLEWEEEYREPFRSMLAHPRVVPVLVRHTPCPLTPCTLSPLLAKGLSQCELTTLVGTFMRRTSCSARAIASITARSAFSPPRRVPRASASTAPPDRARPRLCHSDSPALFSLRLLVCLR